MPENQDLIAVRDLDRLRRSAGGGAQYRTLGRDAAQDLLLLAGYLFELRAGKAAPAAIRHQLTQLPDGNHGLDPAETFNLVVANGLDGSSGFWRDHVVETGRRLVAELAGSADTPVIARLPARRFRVEFRRTFDLAATPTGARLRLRMPLPIEDGQLTDLSVETEAGGAEIRMAPGRLEAKLEAPASSVTIGARFTFTAHPGLPHGKDGEPDRWLESREGAIEVTARVQALADRIARDAPEPAPFVRACYDHLIDTLACGIVNPQRIGNQPAPDWVLEHGWFDCRLGAALLASLCRARGIPARLIGGYLLWDAPSEHYWMEAWLPGQGWTPFDLLNWDLSEGGRDPQWRYLFAGCTDYRMKTQVFPDIFTGAVGVPMGAWHRLQRAIPGGAETRFVSIPEGRPIYSDAIRHLPA